ncbi:MAG: glycosyltransferase [Candidatus Latescibacterota bacterium]|nr:glycosyltransferase [Candidatus Latescibacterota bacterium]
MKVLLVGGFLPGQSLWSIQQGFLRLGHDVIYQPSRGCIEAHRTADIALAAEEADLIPDASHWRLTFRDAAAFLDGLLEIVAQERVELLLWWFPKDDKPARLIAALREQFPHCRTVAHTQDDPWDVIRNPEFSSEFEFAVTCCKESEPVYAERGIRAITLYPPPALELHGKATPSPREACDFSVTMLSLYSREGGERKHYLSSENTIDRVTHPIPFPDQRALRHEVIAAIQDLGHLHVYGGMGFGTFPGVPRPSYRGFRSYQELPGVYTASKININQHNSPLTYGMLNQRDTAITGAGGFMLTDYVNGMEEVFDIGTGIDTWESVEELTDKARWWLAHDEERQRAARSAQQRILCDYGNGAYVQELLRFVASEGA